MQEDELRRALRGPGFAHHPDRAAVLTRVRRAVRRRRIRQAAGLAVLAVSGAAVLWGDRPLLGWSNYESIPPAASLTRNDDGGGMPPVNGLPDTVRPTDVAVALGVSPMLSESPSGRRAAAFISAGRKPMTRVLVWYQPDQALRLAAQAAEPTWAKAHEGLRGWVLRTGDDSATSTIWLDARGYRRHWYIAVTGEAKERGRILEQVAAASLDANRPVG